MGGMGGHVAVRTVFAPYDSGHRGVRMGAGPGHLWDNGLPELLRSESRPLVTFVDVVPESDPPAEVATAFELDRLVAGQVREAVSAGEFPLVLSGNCNTSVGTIAGAGPEGLGVVWFDAHADFETPETTTTGFTDGMGLAIVVGHCWKTMAEGVPASSRWWRRTWCWRGRGKRAPLNGNASHPQAPPSSTRIAYAGRGWAPLERCSKG